MERLGGFEGVDSVAVEVLGRDHFEGLHHGVDMVCAVPVEGYGNTISDGVVRVIFDLQTAYFLFPECDPNLPLALEGDGVPLLFGRSYHVPVLGRNVRFEQFEHGSPTVPLDDNVV